MSEAVLNELPEKWGWSTLGEICEKPQYGWTTKASQDGDLHLLRTTDITSGQINWDTVPYYVIEPEDKEKYRINDGDIVVSRAGSVGVSYLISNPEPSVFTSYLIRFKPLIDRKYVYYFLKSPTFCSAISEKSSGIALQNVNASKLKEIDIPVAPPEQQKRIVAKIEELFSHIDAGIEALKKAKQLLKQYRQSVLKAAVTNELTKDLPCRQAGWRDTSFRNISDKRVPEESKSYFTYVLECDDGSLYKGFTKNLFNRINQHLDGRGAKWTKEYKPISIIHFEKFPTEKEAIEREKYFKSGSGREWLNEIKIQKNKKHEPASQLLERILKERRQKWEEQQLEQFKAKGKIPKDDKWKGKYPEPVTLENLDIPDTWITASFDQLTEYITSGSRGWAKFYADTGATFIRAQNLKYDNLNLDNIAYVSLPDKAEGMRTRVKYGDLLVTITGANVTKTGCVNIELDEAYVSQHVALCRPVEVNVASYLYTYLISKGGARKKLEEAAYGAGKPRLNLDNLKTLMVALPSYEELEEIVKLVDERFSSIKRLGDVMLIQLRKAEINKQSVLASAFSGVLQG